MKKQIYVTKPYLPPLQEFVPYLEKIWQNEILTNNGPFHQKLEDALCDYLGVNYISLFSNGTLALITALQALGIKGEVITTPYSFVATAHSILWNGNVPVFVDVEPETLNIDPKKIEEAITPKTTAILPVHCYGNPCDVDAIKEIANKYELRVIYDACHAFGVKDEHGSILRHGDLSCISFHATKVFNTFEGGAIVSHDIETKKYIDQLKNFGIIDEVTVAVTGLNAKMSEINAAFGLLQLQHIDEILMLRSQIDYRYRYALNNVDGIICLPQAAKKTKNFSYFPILVQEKFKLTRDQLYNKLKINGINARRYFYPLISDFSMYANLSSSNVKNLPVAANAANNILCLPMYPGIPQEDIDVIVKLIVEEN